MPGKYKALCKVFNIIFKAERPGFLRYAGNRYFELAAFLVPDRVALRADHSKLRVLAVKLCDAQPISAAVMINRAVIVRPQLLPAALVIGFYFSMIPFIRIGAVGITIQPITAAGIVHTISKLEKVPICVASHPHTRLIGDNG